MPTLRQEVSALTLRLENAEKRHARALALVREANEDLTFLRSEIANLLGLRSSGVASLNTVTPNDGDTITNRIAAYLAEQGKPVRTKKIAAALGIEYKNTAALLQSMLKTSRASRPLRGMYSTFQPRPSFVQ